MSGSRGHDTTAGVDGFAAPGTWRVVVPVLDEEAALPELLAELRGRRLLGRAIFVDNGSRDGSAALLSATGVALVRESRRGYGFACLAGARTALAAGAAVVAFMEGDGSDDPGDLPRLLTPILAGEADLVVGSRRRAVRRAGLMPWHQRAGNGAAAASLRLLFGIRLPDNGPFRAVRGDLLAAIAMEERPWAWPTEMTVKVHLAGGRIACVETDYRPRRGRSKIAGTWRGSAGALLGIFGTMARLRLAAARSRATREAE